MASIFIADRKIAAVNGMSVDIFDTESLKHTFLDVPEFGDGDRIFDIILSLDCIYLALLTTKRVLVYDLKHNTSPKIINLPRAAMKIIFIENNNSILVADKTGDVLKYNIKEENTREVKLLSHISLLLDILMTENEKFIITCDRDEKIKVSCFPNTYNIQAFCLGHKEFVKCLQLLPHNKSYLLSSSGDGTIKLWNYINGNLCLNINTCDNVCDKNIITQFIDTMNEDGVLVSALPILQMTSVKFSESISVIAVILLNLNSIFIYSINEDNNNFSHNLEQKIILENPPFQIQFYESFLYIYNNPDVIVYHTMNDIINYRYKNTIHMFENKLTKPNLIENDLIKILYKRKFDNVEEYMERKKQRLENKR